MDPDFSGFNQTFQLMQGLFVVVFLVVIGGIVFTLVKAASRAAKNSAAPEVTAVAQVVAKRTEVSGGGSTMHDSAMSDQFGMSMSHDSPVTQQYFVTFEQSGGERFELQIPGTEYGLLAEGDRGSVTMKGDRYLGFARELMR